MHAVEQKYTEREKEPIVCDLCSVYTPPNDGNRMHTGNYFCSKCNTEVLRIMKILSFLDIGVRGFVSRETNVK